MSEVVWTDQARDLLADIYVAMPADQRDELVLAVTEIEAHLSVNGVSAGESRSGNNRIYFHAMLAVVYKVVPRHPIKITAVQLTRPKRRG